LRRRGTLADGCTSSGRRAQGGDAGQHHRAQQGEAGLDQIAEVPVALRRDRRDDALLVGEAEELERLRRVRDAA
jgi:hypothetical protein